MSWFKHETAIVAPTSKIGTNTKIWHFCHIMEHTIIGNNCVIGQNVFIAKNVRIGNGVKIQNNVSVYEGVILEDDVFISPSVVFTNVINPRSFIERKTEYQPTLIKKGASLGANATIVCGITIGSFAFVGAGAVVTQNVKNYALVVGNPSKQIGWISESGIRLKFNVDGTGYCAEEHCNYQLKNDEVVKIES